MRGLIPDSVLAPRAYKTGVPRGYFQRQMAIGLREVIDRVFGFDRPSKAGNILLAELGIIDVEAFRKAIDSYFESEDHLTGVQLFLTVEAELWVRCRGAC